MNAECSVPLSLIKFDETVSVLFSELESFSAIGTFHLLFGGFGVPYGKVDGMEGGRRKGDLKWEKGRVGRELACRLKRFQPSLLKCETTDVAIHNLGAADPFKYSKRYSLAPAAMTGLDGQKRLA